MVPAFPRQHADDSEMIHTFKECYHLMLWHFAVIGSWGEMQWLIRRKKCIFRRLMMKYEINWRHFLLHLSFVTHEGHYQFLKIPFGLCNLQSVFQCFINTNFRALVKEGIVFPFMDDIISLSSNENEAVSRHLFLYC